MREVTLLQLGDVHFPDYDSEFDVDVKDDAFPTRLVGSTSKTMLSASLRSAARQREERGAILMIVGDITTNGNSDGYMASGTGLLRYRLGLE